MKCHNKILYEYKTDEWQKVGSRRSKTEAKRSGTGFYMVLARGFQWKVTKKDVMFFFKGIKILNGEKGINIIKNIAMEAFIELVSKTDVKKALALNNKRVDSRTVHGKFRIGLIFYFLFFLVSIVSDDSTNIGFFFSQNSH